MTAVQYQKKYAVFTCHRCGSVGYMRTAQKTSICRHCGQRNQLLLRTMKILLLTDDVQEALAAVQVAKFKRKTFRIKSFTLKTF